MQNWGFGICKSLDVEGISQKRENIGVTTKDYKWIDGGTDLETEFGLAWGNSDTFIVWILQRLVGKQYLLSIRCKADRITAAIDLKLKLHVCLIYYNSQM